MKISVVAHDLSGGAAVTAIGVADALAVGNEVVIIGPQFRNELWPSLHESPHRIVPIRSTRGARFLLGIPKLARALRADVIVCCKPRFPSLVPALLNKLLHGTRIMLVVDDDELAMTEPGRAQPLRRKLVDPAGFLYTRIAHRLRRFVDETICVSQYLQQIYGGAVIPLPRDLSDYDPAKHDGARLRSELGLAADDFVVGFIGIPRAHKGMDVLLEAIRQAQIPSCRLMIVPPASYHELDDLRQLAAGSAGQILLVEGRPSSQVPDFLAACDAVAIPQKRSAQADAQVPAKLIEAMAMGKAIVASALSDMPRFLEGRGVVIEPEDPAALARALERLHRDLAERRAFGEGARRYYLEQLSHAALGPRLRERLQRISLPAGARRSAVSN